MEISPGKLLTTKDLIIEYIRNSKQVILPNNKPMGKFRYQRPCPCMVCLIVVILIMSGENL